MSFFLHPNLNIITNCSSSITRLKMLSNQKILGIGFHRTGTRSLFTSLERLGIKSTHFPYGYEEQMKEGFSNQEVMAVLSPIVSTHQAFADTPYSVLYPEFDQLFPGCRFVFTRRDSDSWWRSLTNHWLISEGAYRLTPFEQVQYNQVEPHLYQLTLEDKAILIAKYEQHNDRVLQYFKHRPDDLLIIEWNDGEHGFSWEKLCDFLDVTMPEDTSVPWIK